MSADALASFEAKWSLAQPELPLALRFSQRSIRPIISAFICLSNEINHAAFHIVEPEVATTKLNWWAEELEGLSVGKPRHPLTEVLARFEPIRSVPANQWASVINGAFHQREAGPSASLNALLASSLRLAAPLAEIEANLNPKLAPEALAQVAARARCLHDTGRLNELLARDRLPIPLDLLAKHQLSRVDLTHSSERRAFALREHFSELAAGFDAVDRNGLSPLAAMRLSADHQRSRRAACALDPLAESMRNLDRLPLSSVWAGWRAARRMQASG
ncbi:MAG: squalene/phytoene synthase family protein [Dokdonella sp.]